MTTGSTLSSQAEPDKIQTVIAVRPGVIRVALQSLLASLPRLKISGVAGGGLSALRLIRTCKPALLVIDCGLLEDEIAMLLRQIKHEQPQIRCLVFTETYAQQQILLGLGADAGVLRSEPSNRLVEALNNLGLC